MVNFVQWRFGNYGRLSKDEKGEKLDSKDTQLKFNAQFINDNELGVIVDNYFDDDISGTIFTREDLDRLIDDIESGKINAIVVKDLSRLGRSNAKTLTFIEYLEEKGVRLISINDHYDSTKDSDDLIGIKTWYNERYVKDISVKIRSNIHQKLKQGEYLGTAPYGYRKEYQSKNNKLIPINVLLVDEKIRPIIEEIYKLYIQGYGYGAIADMMERKDYPNPSQYKNYDRQISPRWSKDHIKRIILNRVYCGDTVQGISEKLSYKSKKTKRKSQENWYITENTHEAIIEKEIWKLAQESHKERLINNNIRHKNTIHLFSGFLVCGACEKSLVARKSGTRPLGYICINYSHFGKRLSGGCESHHIREDNLKQIIYNDIFNLVNDQDREDGFHEYFLSKHKEKDFTSIINGFEKEVTQYNKYIKDAYHDKLKGVVSESIYLETVKDFQTRIDHLENQITNLKQEATKQKSISKNIEQLKNLFEEIITSGKLTKEMLKKCLRKIYVFLPGDIKDGEENKWMVTLKTNMEGVMKLKDDGGLGIVYKF